MKSTKATRTIADQLPSIDISYLMKGLDIMGSDNYTFDYIHGIGGVNATFRTSRPYIKPHASIELDDWSLGRFHDISITSTPCNFGGQRYWFICPYGVSGHCLDRVRILYFKHKRFGCRNCQHVTYRSRMLNYDELTPGYDYYEHKANKLEQSHKVHRQTYCGKPTKRLQRIEKLREKALDADEAELTKIVAGFKRAGWM